jgi:hypothetical protein
VAYIGNDLQVAFSTYKNIDDISGSFDGVTTSFALLVNGVAPAPLPLNSNQCLISVGGVVQRPDDTGTEGFRLSGGNIVFSSAPNTAEDFFGVILAGADYVNAGANFPDGTLAAPSITFDQDNDTGYYRSGSGAVSFASNGVAAGTWSSAGVTAPALIPTGSSVPANGVYLPAANTVGVATNGTGRLFIDASGRLLIGTSTTDTVGVGSGGAQLQSVAANPFSAARFSNDAFGCVVAIGKSRGASAGSYTVVQNNDILGEIRFAGADGTDLQTIGAQINAEVDGTPGANDLPGRLVLSTTADGASSSTERVRVTSAGRVGINTASPGSVCHVAGSNGDGLTVSGGGATGVFRSSASGTELGSTSGDNTVFLSGSGTERMRISSGGHVSIAKTGYISVATNGHYFDAAGWVHHSVDAECPLFLNRNVDDGNLIVFYQAGVAEGSISVSGTTVSYNGAHLSRWSQLPSDQERIEILRGSVLSNLDEMCEWIDPPTEAVLWEEGDELPEGVNVGDIKEPANPGGPQSNEQLNRMKVSDVEGDKNVSGVFQAWDDDDDTYTNDFYCAMTGDFIIRIGAGTPLSAVIC